MDSFDANSISAPTDISSISDPLFEKSGSPVIVKEQAPYHTYAIANYFIAARQLGAIRNLDSQKLIKLIYLSQAFASEDTETDNVQLFDEPIYAWEFGPGIRSIYHELLLTGAETKRQLQIIDPTKKVLVTPFINTNDIKTVTILEKTITTFGGMDIRTLSTLTSLPNLAWDRTIQKNGYIRPQAIGIHQKKVTIPLNEMKNEIELLVKFLKKMHQSEIHNTPSLG